MARIFITGSTEGLGRAAALALLDEGHQVVLHARNPSRVESLGDLARRAEAVVLGDLARAEETRGVAQQVNAIGRMDAVIHNAGVFKESDRAATPEGHARTLAVNVLAPYLLTAEIERPDRIIYLSSEMHLRGDPSLNDIDWVARPWNGTQAYSDSKLFVTAFAFLLARRWPDIVSNAVDPGWVPTRMGGPGAPDDLVLGHTTQVWLAVGSDANAMSSAGYWHHQRHQAPAPAVSDPDFQDALLDKLARLTGVRLT